MSKILNAAALATLIAATSLPALARDEIVTFTVDGQTVVGTLTLPESAEPAPVVLMLFGFLGNRAEWPIAGTEEGPYARAARLWADKGVASLRIDYRGSGESGGTFAEATLSTEIADSLAALDFLKADKRVDAGRLGIVGWSLGGLVATAVSAQSPDVDALALWNAVANPIQTFTGLLGADAMAKGLGDGDAPVDAAMPWGAPVSLSRTFIRELHAADPIAEMKGFAGPLFVAQGDLDQVVSPDGAPLYLAAHEGVEEAWTRPMDHMFNAEQGAETVDELITASAGFFAQNLR